MRHITFISMVILLFVIINLLLLRENRLRVSEDHLLIEHSTLSQRLGEAPWLNRNSLAMDETIKTIKKAKFNKPKEWGENVSGVIRSISTNKKIIALTFDACGGEWGSDYDKELLNFLIAEQIPATLFINSRWIDANLEEFLYLSSLDQFQIENHGTEHLPLSITGGTAWGIKGTSSVEDVITEVVTNYEKIKSLTGHTSRYFRAGTAFYDEIAVNIVEQLGMKVVNFDVLGDAGATFSADQVRDALLKSNPGSIALLHMNQPEKETAEGIKMAIPLLREKGFTFVTLNEGFKLESQ